MIAPAKPGQLPVPYSFSAARRALNVNVGAVVRRGGKTFRIVQVLDFGSVIGVDTSTGLSTALAINELQPVNTISPTASVDLDQIGDKDWRDAQRRYAAIKPLLGEATGLRELTETRAAEIGVNAATLYRWMSRYKVHGEIAALIPRIRGRRRGNYDLPPATEEIIREATGTHYLTIEKLRIQKTIDEVLRLCHVRHIDPPSAGTIRTRLNRLPERVVLRGRGEAERARNLFTAKPGSFPGADYPLAYVQIDHTPVDLILVDDVARKPIGRAWLTVAIDVCTRMICGYYLSLDSPSFLSVGMCLTHAMLPKEQWLLLHGVEAQWPVWGIPVTLHSDNGSDFRGDNLKQSCAMYNINRDFRPIKRPHYGGHIERLMGTLSSSFRAIPGSTFSTIAERGEYDAVANAVMTLGEFETMFVTLITKSYHQKIHSQLGVSPARAWEVGIFGDDERPGIGMPERPVDQETMVLDFFECCQRTVQPDGVVIDGVSYYGDAIRPWINAKQPDRPKEKRKFVFRRDPRDISAIWFFDPELKRYFKLPYADQSRRPISVWELGRAKRKLKEQGLDHLDQRQIFDAATAMQDMVADSKKKTLSARREEQKQRQNSRGVTPASPFSASRPIASGTSPGTAPSAQSAISLPEGWIDGDFEFSGEIS